MQRENEVQHVFLVGAKSLGAYGGYETFVYKLTEYHQNKKNIKYHVACKANGDGCMDETKVDSVTRINDHEFEFHNAHCFKIDIPQIGPAQAIYYDVAALKACCKYIKEHRIKHPIVYIMACRIGPFAGHFYKEIHKLGGTVYLNPDGHEWMRAKWSAPIRRYWKISEQMMVKYCDLAICDSVNIEKYIHECYDGKGIKGSSPKTTFIAYGADLTLSKLADDDEKLVSWYKEKGLTKKGYYLVVGRFVPENSFEVMIREFMKSKSEKDFALITNVNDKFLNELEEKLHFKSDKRIKFVGTVYDQELLKKIRENIQVSKLKLLKANHTSQIYSLESDIARRYPREITAAKGQIEALKTDMEAAKPLLAQDKDHFAMEISGKVYTERKEAGAAIIEACKALKAAGTEGRIGSYGAFELHSRFDNFDKVFRLSIKGAWNYSMEVGKDPLGNILRVTNALTGIERALPQVERRLETLEQQLAQAKEEAKRPFTQEAELAEKSARLAELNSLLNMDEKGSEDALGVDEDAAETEVADRPRQPANYAGRVAERTADNVRKPSVLAQLHAKQAEPQKPQKRKSHDMEL